ncbi:MAG: hypothetical protein COA99_07545 [Moraxellaceae bacterium]|nr:MAG: hypothetical protein COA99_07545 [Moraxellaceae bacterium]
MTKLLLKKALFWLPFVAVLTACGSGGPGSEDEDSAASGSDIPIAYIKRTIVEASGIPPADAPFFLNFEAFVEGSASVHVRTTSADRQITPSEGDYDVRQLTVDNAGENLLFAMRGPLVAPSAPGDPAPVQPAWGIWEYTVATQLLVQLTQGDATNHIHDIDPAYLPDGRIIFSSSRQETTQKKLGDEGKPQYRHLTENGDDGDTDARTFNLHILGSDRDIGFVKQITFNLSHDFNPSLTADGQVLFSRWDNMGSTDSVSIYRMNPDGSAMELLFGHNSPNIGVDTTQTIRYTRPKALGGGRVLVQLRSDSDQLPQLQLAVLDVDNFIDDGVVVDGGSGTAVDLEYLGFAQTMPGVPALDGRLSAITPVEDGTGRYLISWTLCQLSDLADPTAAEAVIQACSSANIDSTTLFEAAAFYGIFMFDPSEDQKIPVVLPAAGVYYTDIVVVQSHTAPTSVAEVSLTGDADLVERNVGLLHIRSVYNMDGVFDDLSTGLENVTNAKTIPRISNPSVVTADQRQARFLRLSKVVPLWDEDTRDVDSDLIAGTGRMTEIVGYAEIEPDGSVLTEVPADIAFTFSIVNGDGVRLGETSRHTNWLQLRPGEKVTCNGCHAAPDDDEVAVAHGRVSGLDTFHPGSPTLAYPNVDPVMAPEIGETMAETHGRIDPNSIKLASSMDYTDVWAEPASKITPVVGTSYDDLVMSFADVLPPVTYFAPLNFPSCATDWQPNCRVVINYETHIHPIWSKPRIVLDVDAGVDIDGTCVSCHNHDIDPADGEPRTAGNSFINEFPIPNAVPVQQLYLGNNDAINADLDFEGNGVRMDAYDYLFNEHPRGIVEAMVLVQQRDAPFVVYTPQLDDEGNIVLNPDNSVLCDPGISTFRLFTLPASLMAGQAITVIPPMAALDDFGCPANYELEPKPGLYGDFAPDISDPQEDYRRNFFTKFLPRSEQVPKVGVTGNTNHDGWLTAAEHRLIKEWVDMGGQYYNSPFDAPSN